MIHRALELRTTEGQAVSIKMFIKRCKLLLNLNTWG